MIAGVVLAALATARPGGFFDDPTVRVALIVAMGGLGTASLGILNKVWLNASERRQGEAIDAVRHEVTNDHTRPLRDDMDGKHDDVLSTLATVLQALSAVESLPADFRDLRRDVGGVKSDVREIRGVVISSLGRVNDRLTALEKDGKP